MPMLRPAGEARQDQKWRVGIMSRLFGRIRRYYALRTSHDVVVAYSCQQLQGVRCTLLCGVEAARCGLLGSPGNRSREAAGVTELRCICDGYPRTAMGGAMGDSLTCAIFLWSQRR